MEFLLGEYVGYAIWLFVRVWKSKKGQKLLLALAANELIPLMKRNRQTHTFQHLLPRCHAEPRKHVSPIPFTYNRLLTFFSILYILYASIFLAHCLPILIYLSPEKGEEKWKTEKSEEKSRSPAVAMYLYMSKKIFFVFSVDILSTTAVYDSKR